MLFVSIGTFALLHLTKKYDSMDKIIADHGSNEEMYRDLFLDNRINDGHIRGKGPAWMVNSLYYLAKYEGKIRKKYPPTTSDMFFLHGQRLVSALKEDKVYYWLIYDLFYKLKNENPIQLSEPFRDLATLLYIYRPNTEKSQKLTVQWLSDKYGSTSKIDKWLKNVPRFEFDNIMQIYKDVKMIPFFPLGFIGIKSLKLLTDYTDSEEYISTYKSLSDRNQHLLMRANFDLLSIASDNPAWMVNALYYLATFLREDINNYQYLILIGNTDKLLNAFESLDCLFTQNGVYSGLMREMYEHMIKNHVDLIPQLLIDFATTFFVYRPHSFLIQRDAVLKIADEYNMNRFGMKWIKKLSFEFIDPYVDLFRNPEVVRFYPKLYVGVKLLVKDTIYKKIEVRGRYTSTKDMYMQKLANPNFNSDDIINLEPKWPSNALKYCGMKLQTLKTKSKSFLPQMQICSTVIDLFKDLDKVFTQNGVYYQIMRYLFDKLAQHQPGQIPLLLYDFSNQFILNRKQGIIKQTHLIQHLVAKYKLSRFVDEVHQIASDLPIGFYDPYLYYFKYIMNKG
eukprot:NODE_392_length_8143_cov_0.403282.p1 type:complete len:564 gc:universal NODE_392_length_8143_cov_0.403282:3350-1659(-)